MPLTEMDSDLEEKEVIEDADHEELDTEADEAGAEEVEEVEVEAEEEAEPVEDKEDKEDYSKRVQKRIDKLTARSKFAEEQLEQERQRRLELAERLAALEEAQQSHQTERVETTLEAELRQAKTRKKEAFDEGDYDTLESADDEIWLIRQKIEKQKQEASLRQNTPRAQPERTPVPPAEQEWLDSNKWFNDGNYAEEQEGAASVYKRLLKEGRDKHDKSFYDELNRRVKAAFPHLKPSDEQEAPTKPRSSPVAGNSRAATAQRANRGKFTEADKSTMIKYGFGDPSNIEDRKAYLKYSRGEEL